MIQNLPKLKCRKIRLQVFIMSVDYKINDFEFHNTIEN